MKTLAIFTLALFLFAGSGLAASEKFQADTISTKGGPLVITFLGHASLYFTFQGQVIHVDPTSREADYSALPKADLALVTHEHGDHLDPEALAKVRKEGTTVLVSRSCAGQVEGAKAIQNGETRKELGLTIEAVPAYNLVHLRDNGRPFHAKGDGNGYVLTFGDKRVYVAGDTENTPEMKQLKNIDIAFLPMNLPYTMTPEMVAEAALAFRPKVLYPYHFGSTDVGLLQALLKDAKDIEVRVRQMK